MTTNDLSNQTPDQENISAKEESLAISENQAEESNSLSDETSGEPISEPMVMASDSEPQSELQQDVEAETTQEPVASGLSPEPLQPENDPVVEEVSAEPEPREAEDEETEVAAEPEVKVPEPEMETPQEDLPEPEPTPEFEADFQVEPVEEIVEETKEVPETDEAKMPEEDIVEAPAAVAEEIDEEKEDTDDELEEEEVNEAIFQNLSRQELAEHLESLVQEQDLQSIKVKVALIKVAFLHKEKEEQQLQFDTFLKEGGIPENYSPEADNVSERFVAALNIYREKRQKYNEELEKEKLTNLEAKKKILEELKTLINSEETLKKTYDEFKTLQEEWRKIGMVPKNEINQLWQNYHFLVEKFFDKVKINKELKDLDLRKNLERKIELCEKTEELLIETSILKSFKQLQKYHDEWKEIGPVPQDKKDEIWERFKMASDQINERRREYYSTKQDELESNYLAKSALCEQAEKMIGQNPETLRQWQNRTTEVNDLLRVWKTIGPCPKRVNTEVWNRFKTCLDSHFTSYKEYLEKLKDQQLNNYNLKLDLCAQAEGIKNSTDWRKTTQELIKLQQEWKSIGAVPRKYSEKIWKRFRTACDEFFKRKSEFFSSVVQVEEENMKKKEDLISKLEEMQFAGNRQENLELLKNFQREWLEIGHVPIREKDRLQNAFRSALNKHFDKLKIDASEVTALNYRNRLESMKEMPDSGKVIYRERNALQLKASKLQEDIKLWENNIGYLADSKNANLVKVEFQKKIDQAKQELALMEAKLRYLKEM